MFPSCFHSLGASMLSQPRRWFLSKGLSSICHRDVTWHRRGAILEVLLTYNFTTWIEIFCRLSSMHCPMWLISRKGPFKVVGKAVDIACGRIVGGAVEERGPKGFPQK